jgi:hypothetical protein
MGWPSERSPTLLEVRRLTLALEIFTHCKQSIKRDLLYEDIPSRKLTDLQLPEGFFVREDYQTEYRTTTPELYAAFEVVEMLIALVQELPPHILARYHDELIGPSPHRAEESAEPEKLENQRAVEPLEPEKPRNRGGRPPYPEDLWLWEQVNVHNRNPDDLYEKWLESWSPYRHAKFKKVAFRNAYQKNGKKPSN